ALLHPGPLWFGIAGVATAWVFYILKPHWPDIVRDKLSVLVRILDNKYGLDDFNQAVFGNGAIGLGKGLWKGGDVAIIDGLLVNGSARTVGFLARMVRMFQSGYVYRYAFAMIFGLLLILSWWLYHGERFAA